jgi:hypothetical protein
VPSIEDQVVVAAWRLLAEPRLERLLAGHVWGFRRGRGTRGAVAALAHAGAQGALVRSDIRRMFESLDQRYLRAAMERAWPGAGLGHRLVERGLGAWSPGQGVPTGVAWSPALSNAYLALGVDRALADALRSGRLAAAIRYADDFALVAPGNGRDALRLLRRSVGSARLRLHPGKTRVHRFDRPEDWPARLLGVDFTPHRR